VISEKNILQASVEMGTYIVFSLHVMSWSKALFNKYPMLGFMEKIILRGEGKRKMVQFMVLIKLSKNCMFPLHFLSHFA
jgi:hypothetical protein